MNGKQADDLMVSSNMKFVLIAAAILSVAIGGPVQPDLVVPEVTGLEPNVPASVGVSATDGLTPSILPKPIAMGTTDNFEASAVGSNNSYEPIAVGPVLVDEPSPNNIKSGVIDNYEQISIGPAIIDKPIQYNSVPLVQIILNIKPSQYGAIAIPRNIDILPETIESVQIVDSASESDHIEEAHPVQVVNTPAIDDPVNVVDSSPLPIDPVFHADPSRLAFDIDLREKLTKKN
ncbi:uncharacterized protein LOC131852860 [Achroia grisella]|uniref:uncharacterized protein LOC131852860 n=1 Tax=Achroia grisella TaxID=688607 RepID=UPI0027D1EF43|nr:uncharacterized protein LOC131852860 [Achroia grisella]